MRAILNWPWWSTAWTSFRTIFMYLEMKRIRERSPTQNSTATWHRIFGLFEYWNMNKIKNEYYKSNNKFWIQLEQIVDWTWQEQPGNVNYELDKSNHESWNRKMSTFHFNNYWNAADINISWFCFFVNGKSIARSTRWKQPRELKYQTFHKTM